MKRWCSLSHRVPHSRCWLRISMECGSWPISNWIHTTRSKLINVQLRLRLIYILDKWWHTRELHVCWLCARSHKIHIRNCIQRSWQCVLILIKSRWTRFLFSFYFSVRKKNLAKTNLLEVEFGAVKHTLRALTRTHTRAQLPLWLLNAVISVLRLPHSSSARWKWKFQTVFLFV